MSTKSVSFRISQNPTLGKSERILGHTRRPGFVFYLVSLSLGVAAALMVSEFLATGVPVFSGPEEVVSAPLTPEERAYRKRLEVLSEEIVRVRRYEAELKRKALQVDLAIAEAKRLSSNPKAARKKNQKTASLRTSVGGVGGGDDDAVLESVNDLLSFGRIIDDKTGDPVTRPLYDRLEDLTKKVTFTPIGTPVDGRVSSHYGMRRSPFKRRRWQMHKGIDIVAPWRTPVEATADGVVAKAAWIGGFGRVVVIDHGNGMETRFAHLSRIKVRKGQRVSRGDIVGLLGSTGRSTGSHLHYEIRIGGKAVDPVPFIRLTDTLAKL